MGQRIFPSWTSKDKLELALYINIPFCKSPCSYCHYTDNISFGHQDVPDDYFELLKIDLLDVCRFLQSHNSKLKSIYFGGGTPSLLSDEQLLQIRSLLNIHGIESDEISMELHPGAINFTLEHNDFFTRYSVAVQTFNDKQLEKYHRNGYNFQTVQNLVQTLRVSTRCRSINIDLLFYDQDLDCQETAEKIASLNPDTVIVYPNTKGRGSERLIHVLQTLQTFRACLKKKYVPILRSSFIFTTRFSRASEYSIIENETFGDIIGIGHNSVSSIGNKTFLTRYDCNGKLISFIERENKGSRYLYAFLRSLPTGVSLKSVREIFPELLLGHFLCTVSPDNNIDNDDDINEKHTVIPDSSRSMVYLPETEYIRFYRNILKNYPDVYKKAFLATIGHGDSDLTTITQVYNKHLFLDEHKKRSFANIYGKNPEYKITTPVCRILVEGIDGSGKDTFVKFFVRELKQYFLYDTDSLISVMGQPDSSLPSGESAKRFIEQLQYETRENVVLSLRENRIASEKKICSIPGICILIRGFVTDRATFSYAFPDDTDSMSEHKLGEGEIISNWDYYIVVDTDENTADARIEKRGIPRTWRESLGPLSFFRNYYLQFNDSKLFTKKIIIKNTSFDDLKNMARKLTNEIYAKKFLGELA